MKYFEWLNICTGGSGMMKQVRPDHLFFREQVEGELIEKLLNYSASY